MNFNPRARVGRDARALVVWFFIGNISIHAPVWGATFAPNRWGADGAHFNPRARVGRDMSVTFFSVSPSYFNPRARVGRDADGRRQAAVSRNFNPRARVGRDWGLFAKDPDIGISIHAPAWGATGLVSGHAAS